MACQAMSQVWCARNEVGKRRMLGDPAADLRGIAPAPLVEPAVLIAARRCIGFGLGVTQQHQTAHGTISVRFKSVS
jgi:hypothetical protein